MLTHSEIETLAAEIANPITQYLEDPAWAWLSKRAAKIATIDSDRPRVDRKALLARANEYRASHIEGRDVVPTRAKVVKFPGLESERRNDKRGN